MSDSEDNDPLPSNVFSFQNENTTVCARGPNINATNLTGLSLRHNMTSTIHNNMTRDFERQQYLELGRDKRSRYCRRDTSPPMSLHSGSDFRPRNFQESYYPRGMSCQRSMIKGRSSSKSMINGRSGSPMSMRSIDSNESVATGIAMAFKNVNFNKYDLRIIKEAYDKFLKRKFRHRIEKRRNRRLYLKGHRRKSGYDSVGSDSSISDDDCRSTSSAMYRGNTSSCRSTKTDISMFRQSMKESNIYNDRTDSLRQNSFRNMFNVAPRGTSVHTQNREQCLPTGTQKERFRAGFPLPSQRFNQSLASLSIPERRNMLENHCLPKNLSNPSNQYKTPAGHGVHETDSEQEEIFSGMSLKEKSIYQSKPQSTTVADERKRSLENSDYRLQSNKKSKLSSPKQSKTEASLQKETAFVLPTDINKANEFQFVKPQFPIRKAGSAKHKEVKEKLLAKSALPTDNLNSAPDNLRQTLLTEPNITLTQQSSKPKCISLNKDKEPTCSNDQSDETLVTQLSTSDVSMRPSFIKRKLYTQKLDVMESKNLSSDNVAADSPQSNVYSAIQKEKNKARKLITNQSCLSRDVQQEDNNLIDLIHKIVPPDRMNITNKSDNFNNNSKNKMAKDDKWDVTSIISTCNNDDVSDTYTDEEIFEVDDNKTKKSNKTPEKKTNDAKILTEKIPHNKETVPKQSKSNNSSMENKDINKKGNVYNCVKSFWETDLESDLENNGAQEWKSNQKENCFQGNFIRHTSLNKTKGPNTDNPKVLLNDLTKSSTLANNNTNSITNHVRKLNLSLSLMKKAKSEGNRVELSQAKATKKTKESTGDKKCSTKTDKDQKNKKIVMDCQNSLSDTTQDHSVVTAIKPRCVTCALNGSSGNLKKNNDELDNPKLISDLNKKSNKATVTKSNTKAQVKKNNVTVSKDKIQSPRAKTELKIQESNKTKQTQKVNNRSKASKSSKEKELDAKKVSTSKKKVNSSCNNTQNESTETSIRITRSSISNNNTIDSDTKKNDKGTKSTAKSKANIKPQSRNTSAIDCIAKRKSPRTPKGIRCCGALTPDTDLKMSKTSGKETQPNKKKTFSRIKTFLDNNNSTLSDGTLDEILKQNSRSLRSSRNKIVLTPISKTRSRAAGNRN